MLPVAVMELPLDEDCRTSLMAFINTRPLIQTRTSINILSTRECTIQSQRHCVFFIVRDGCCCVPCCCILELKSQKVWYG